MKIISILILLFVIGCGANIKRKKKFISQSCRMDTLFDIAQCELRNKNYQKVLYLLEYIETSKIKYPKSKLFNMKALCEYKLGNKSRAKNYYFESYKKYKSKKAILSLISLSIVNFHFDDARKYISLAQTSNLLSKHQADQFLLIMRKYNKVGNSL